MTASENALSGFVSTSKTSFVIPIYQRNYDWQDHHCSQLLNDIITVAKEDKRPSHFIGSIVYMQDGLYTSADIKEFIVIDGQQRLTTVSIIYAVLYRRALEWGQEEEAAEIKELYLVNRFAKGKKEKLWQTEDNAKIYTNILTGKTPEQESFSRIRENFNFFYERITDQVVYDLVKIGLNKLSFVEITLERGKDDPQRIFESLNSTGLDLSQADLIRNYVLMGHSREVQQLLYDTYWRDIEKLARQDSDQTNMVSDFVRAYLTFRNRKIPKKDLVYETFKTRFTDRSVIKVEHLLQELKTYAGYYGKLINPERCKDTNIRQHLEYIKLLRIDTSYPFLLQVLHDYHIDRISGETLIEILELVQSFVFRRFVVNLPTNALNKIFMRLYEEVQQDAYTESVAAALLRKKGTQQMPDDDEVKSYLRERDMYNIQSKNRKYLFYRLENHNNKEAVSLENLTIEHIFPQKPAKGWKKELSDEDYLAFQEKHLHQLGNLTYSGNNGSLGNRVFLDKRDMNKNRGEQGYTFSRLWLNRSLKNKEEWTVKLFKSRHRNLIKRFLEIWPMPDVPNHIITEDKNELTVFEIEDPTGFQVEYAYLGNEDRIEPRSMKDFYISVLSWLFKKNQHPMMRPEVKNTIYLMKNNPNAIAGENIGGNYSVDASNSSWIKFKRLETVLSAYDMEDAVKIKLREV